MTSSLCLGNVAVFDSEAAKPQVNLETVIIQQKRNHIISKHLVLIIY